MQANISPGSALAPVPFQQLGRGATLPSGADWLFERKFDGYRAQIVSRGGSVRVFTRGHQDWTHRVPHIVAAAAALDCDFTLDGEICATTAAGRTDLSWLSDPAAHGATIVYQAFDLLLHDQDDLIRSPLLARKVRLEHLLARADRQVLRIVPFVRENGESFRAEMLQLKHEGIVGKRTTATYQAGLRSDVWLKFKNRQTGTFRVAGWQLTPGGGVSSLLLATGDDPVRYCGRVGTGFSALERRLLPSLLPKARRCALPTAPSRQVCAAAQWSDLTVIVEVEYLEMSSTGIVREPSFQALRVSKNG